MGFEQQSGMCRPMCTRLNRKTGHLRAANLILDRQRGTWRLAGAGGVRACVGRSTRARSGSIIPAEHEESAVFISSRATRSNNSKTLEYTD